MTQLLDNPRSKEPPPARSAPERIPAEELPGLAHWRDFVQAVPIAFARRHLVLGVRRGDRPLLAVADASHASHAIDSLRRLLGSEARAAQVDSPTPDGAADALRAALNRAYRDRTMDAGAVLERSGVAAAASELAGAPEREDLLDTAGRAPVIKLVNALLFEAIRLRASDVHLQPLEDALRVRMRIDGVLEDSVTLPKPVQEEVLSRVKVMGRMNIAEKRLPQDGRASVDFGGAPVDLRIASLPSCYGERIVVRVLDNRARSYRLDELGMDGATLAEIRRLVSLDHGMILVTGPTGSGKTTTLYAALQEINGRELNIVTLEDPIEYRLDGISQTQVSEKKGLTFASGLRSVLRQDPDVIMVGEVRDRETAVMAIQSALTGHLVLSTLHTNDAPSAVTRLLDLGIEPYLVSSSLAGVLAQRLVRRACPGCVRLRAPSPAEAAWLELAPAHAAAARLADAPGCEACRGSGYRDRIGIFELLVMSNAVRRHVQARSSASELRASAGLATLRDSGIAKVLSGLTSIAEVEKVTVRTSE